MSHETQTLDKNDPQNETWAGLKQEMTEAGLDSGHAHDIIQTSADMGDARERFDLIKETRELQETPPGPVEAEMAHAALEGVVADPKKAPAITRSVGGYELRPPVAEGPEPRVGMPPSIIADWVREQHK